MSGPRGTAAMRFLPVPDGMVLDWHHARGQQLELLLDLEPVAPAGHLDAPVKHGRIWFALQRPAQLQSCHQHDMLRQASQADCHHSFTRLCSRTPLTRTRSDVGDKKGSRRATCADSERVLRVPCQQSCDGAEDCAGADLMWQWPSGEMVSWERSAPSRASMRPVSTIFPLLGYAVRRTILAPLPFSGIVCARSSPSQRQQALQPGPHTRTCKRPPAQW